MALVTAIRRMRAERKMAQREWANVEVVTTEQGIRELLKEYAALVAPLTRSRRIECLPQPTLPGPADHIGAADLDVANAHASLAEHSGATTLADIYLSQEADAESMKAELVRLQKALEQARSEIQRTEKNLANAEFLSRAPEHVVEKIRQRNAKAQAEIQSLTQSISKLEK
ncbi:MAG: hypothetical protein GTO55_00105 [Armatimonadetes bacterium]|nr:hypothetical protein [Armatimonadota bacterium]NIM22743.1 hypothetical protein [Armatimonadota bacterium]NIM66568.1 hypothetical protein [Armatimonadota bacterium]NIM75169.1 hypothetical protein [Armatimonadota bacterium]NIN04793.1 hypothetical protein [Armatimonadota bacterium]